MRSLLRRIRFRTLAAAVLSIAAILAFSYLAIANVLLHTRLLRNAISGLPLDFGNSQKYTSLRLDYQRAYSILPGRVHLDGLTIRGRDSTLEWFVTLDHADVTISLLDLARRSFHATRVRSSGLSIRLRPRLDRDDATPDVVAALPPIAGFADPPLLDDGPEAPPLSDANYHLWMVHLEDVEVAHVREVWIYTLRSEGDMRVRGRWLFRPQRWLEVGPATVESNSVDLFRGPLPVARALRGWFHATVHPFDPRQVKDRAVFDSVSSNGQIDGVAVLSSALRWLAPTAGVRFTRWEGPLDAHVVLDHGKVLDGTRVRIDAADCEIAAAELTVEGPVCNELVVAGDHASFDTHISGLRVLRQGVEQARIGSVAAVVSSRTVQLAHMFDDASFTLDVGGAETNDIGAWKHLLPSMSAIAVRSGKVTADGHADGSLSEKRGGASLRVVARHLSMERGPNRLTATVAIDAQVQQLSLPGGWVVGAATVAIDEVEARLGNSVLAGNLVAHIPVQRGQWRDRTFDLSGSSVALRAFSAKAARGVSIVEIPSLTVAAPRLMVAPSGLDGHVSIDLPRADLPNLGGLRDLVPLPSGLAVLGGSGRGKLQAEIELSSSTVRGDAAVVARGLRARAGKTEFFGDLSCVMRARRTGAADRLTDLSGSTLSIRHAGTGSAAPPADAWWGDLSLGSATLRTSGGVRLDATAHLEAKDAIPATVIVTQNLGVPAWAASVFRMPNLEADARVLLGSSLVEVHSLVARGASTSVRAEYTKRAGRGDGGVLMDLGWLGLGYDLTDGATGLVIVGPQGWFRRKTASMRNAAVAAQHMADAKEQLARYAAMSPGLRREEARRLAHECTIEAPLCDGTTIESLLRAAADPDERDALRGIAYAPMIIKAAKGGTDGTTLDPLVMGSLAEAFRVGGESTLDNIPSVARVAAGLDSNAARGKVIVVTGRASGIRREGPYAVGMLTTDAGSVYFVTPFATQAVAETLVGFRGVYVQKYASATQPTSIVLVGAFVPVTPSRADSRSSGTESAASTH